MALHGLSPFIYRVGFLLSELMLSIVMALFVCLVALVLRVMGPVETATSFFDLFWVLVVFCTSSCSLIMAMSPCFRKPMTAAMVIFLLYFGCIFIFLLAGGSNEAFIHDNVGRDKFLSRETQICRDLYPNDRNGARRINLYPEKKDDPRNKGAMRKWWMDLRRDGYPTLVATKNGYLLGYAAYCRFCTWLGTGVRRKTPSMCAPTHRVRASVGRC